MASAFASLFKSKKKGSNKENESMSANIHRGKPISSSMRQQRVSQSENSKNGPTNGGVYQGGFDLSVQDEGSSFEEQAQNGHYPQQQKHRGKASSVISAATPWSKSKWFQSPYDVVTAPKTKKSSRSCPGGASHPPVPASVASLRHSRHHSPPSSYGSNRHFNNHSHHHQQQYPTIHEVYENYAPRPSSNAEAGDVGSMQRQRYKESSNPRSMVAQPSRTSGHGSVRGHSSLVGVSHTVDNNSYNPLRQRIFGGSNHSRANCDTKYRHPTSEYGSADPSPTNQFPPIPSVSSTSDVGGRTTNGAEEFENTDYDSDSDVMPTDLVQLCTQQLRRVNGKCKTYKETARRYKSKNLRLQAELQMVNEHLAKEKGKRDI